MSFAYDGRAVDESFQNMQAGHCIASSSMCMNQEVLLLHPALLNAFKNVSDPSWWLRSSAVGVGARHWARNETMLGCQLAHFLSDFETLACSSSLSLAPLLHPALKPGRALIHTLGGETLESGQKSLD